jgi:creatinine amidohydrolase/Fe(II)-dependent formamide hydrolase-like protein
MKTVLTVGVTLLTAAQLSAQVQAAGGQGRSMGGGDCAENVWNCADTPNPLPPATTVWLEEMTWMDVRDALAAGKTTVILPTGGIEPNGPFLALGKHNYVLRANCDAIARRLGNALCAPILEFVPEGPVDGSPTGHMNSPGTISLSNETYQAVLTDVARSLRAHGFQNIIFIGDSGGNQAGQEAVAAALNAQWHGRPIVAHIPEYYTYGVVSDHMRQHGLVSTESDNLHDDPVISLNMFVTDPRSIRWEERVRAGLATINGVSVADWAENLERGARIVGFRADHTADAIRRVIEKGGTPQR